MGNQAAASRVDDPGIRILFSEVSKWQSWLDVEVALAEAQAELGIIPTSSAKEIRRKARLELMDVDRIRAGLEKTEHELVPLIWELDRICDGEAGGHIHWGATTQNITQTGNLLNLRRAHSIFLRQLGSLLENLADLAERTKDFVLPGRTHGQHAVPATFGFKVAVWIDELCRHVERFKMCEGRVFVAMLGGGAGTLGSLGKAGLTTQDKMAESLGMGSMNVPARNLADHLAEYVTLLGLLAATCNKMAREVYTLMKQEFGEVEEPVAEGLVGSSTMPQKRNPKLAQRIIAASTEIRSKVPLALEAMLIEHEADGTSSKMMNSALDESCILMGDVLHQCIVVFGGLKVFPERMRQNLDLSGGLIMSEALMMELGVALGRQRAHDVIYDAAQASVVEGRAFQDVLAESEDVKANMTPDQIEDLLDPTRNTGVCALLAEMEVEHAREIAKDLK